MAAAISVFIAVAAPGQPGTGRGARGARRHHDPVTGRAAAYTTRGAAPRTETSVPPIAARDWLEKARWSRRDAAAGILSPC